MSTEIKIKTWVCEACDYHQDTESILCRACAIGKCRCPLAGEPHQNLMKKESNPDKKTTITIMDEIDVDTHKISTGKFGSDGKPLMRDLTPEEKKQYKQKIKDDIKKFKIIEDV